jgi:hypothetical protein
LEDLPTTSGSTLELLREAVELKKLNNNLMKVTMFEDLIADIYARLYEINVPRFIEQANEENRERMKVDHLLMASDVPTDTPTPPTSAPPSEAPVPRGRTKGIARRDIQKRAEAIVNRHAVSRPVATKASMAPSEEDTRPAAATETPGSLPVRDHQRDGAVDGTSGVQSSVPASIHDSADDESELSELSEIDDERLAKLKAEQRPQLLFPNLAARKSPDPTSELSAQVSADGDEGDEGDEGAGEEDEEGNENEGEIEGEEGIAEDEEEEEEEEEAEGQEGEAEGEDEDEGEGEQEDADMEGEDAGEALEEGEDEAEGEEPEAEEEVAEDNEEQGATDDQGETEAAGHSDMDVDVNGVDIEKPAQLDSA